MRLKKKYSLEEISSKYNCKILGDSQTKFEYVSSIFNSKDNSIAYISDIKNLSSWIKQNFHALLQLVRLHLR